MGWCQEFGVEITAGCGHVMVADARQQSVLAELAQARESELAVVDLAESLPDRLSSALAEVIEERQEAFLSDFSRLAADLRASLSESLPRRVSEAMHEQQLAFAGRFDDVVNELQSSLTDVATDLRGSLTEMASDFRASLAEVEETAAELREEALTLEELRSHLDRHEANGATLAPESVEHHESRLAELRAR